VLSSAGADAAVVIHALLGPVGAARENGQGDLGDIGLAGLVGEIP
jgi:hypothetical protein